MNHIQDAYEETRGTFNDRTRMAASQKRKDAIYSRVDNYNFQHRRSPEEIKFAGYAEQIKFQVSEF